MAALVLVAPSLFWSNTSAAIAQAVSSAQARATETAEASFLRVEIGAHTSAVRSVMFTASGQELFSVGYDKTLRIWDSASGESKRVVRFRGGLGDIGLLTAAALQPGGKRIAVIEKAGPAKTDSIVLLDVDGSDDEKVQRVETDLRLLPALAFSPDGTRLVVTGVKERSFGQAQVWDVVSGKRLAQFPASQKQAEGLRQAGTSETMASMVMESIAFSPDGKRIATGNRYGIVRIFDAATQKMVASKSFAADRPVRALAWAPDGVNGGDALAIGIEDHIYPVSYTHLTLPTKRIV